MLKMSIHFTVQQIICLNNCIIYSRQRRSTQLVMPLSSNFTQMTPSTRKVSMFGTQAPSSRTPCILVSEFFMTEELWRTQQPGASNISCTPVIVMPPEAPCSLPSRLQRRHSGTKPLQKAVRTSLMQAYNLSCRTSKDPLKTLYEMEHLSGRYFQYEELC